MTKSTDVNSQQIQRNFNPWLVYTICLAVSLGFMFFFALNSPIHTFNSHCDYHWFMTMGRGMVAGKVPYRDMFEQKGPLIYAIFAVACWFPNPQFVIWCFEVLCISLFLYYCYHIARKFLSPWLSLFVLPLMMMVLSTNYARGLEGSCVEEYCFPIFAYGLLCFLDFIMDHRVANWRRSLVLGICMGILFWTKYTMLEFFLVPLLIWLINNAVGRHWKTILNSVLIMLGGFFLVTLPIVIWFTALGALDDLFKVYFLVNIVNYNGDFQTSVGDFTNHPWQNFGLSFLLGSYYIMVQIFGLTCFTIHNWRRKGGWLLLIAAVTTWLMVGFFCGYLYYYLPLFTYAVLGVIYFVKVIAYLLKMIEVKIKTHAIVVLLFVMVFSFFAALPFVSNTAEINRPREHYAQLIVADMIAQYNQTAEKPATLFCYGMADCGFYNAAGIVPNVRYYAQNSFTVTNFPEMFADFDRTISEQLCDFVITYKYKYLKNQALLSTYYHPYVNNSLEESTLLFTYFEPTGYRRNEIVILISNATNI